MSYLNADENMNMRFWQNFFCWISENMPHVYFSEKLLEEHGYCLTSAYKWNSIYLYTERGNVKIEHDYGYVQEQFDFLFGIISE